MKDLRQARELLRTCTLLFCLMWLPAMSEGARWIGGCGRWSDATHWNTLQVPTEGAVVLPASEEGYILNMDVPVDLSALTIERGATLRVQTNFTVNALLRVEGMVDLSSTPSITVTIGSLHMEPTAVLRVLVDWVNNRVSCLKRPEEASSIYILLNGVLSVQFFGVPPTLRTDGAEEARTLYFIKDVVADDDVLNEGLRLISSSQLSSTIFRDEGNGIGFSSTGKYEQQMPVPGMPSGCVVTVPENRTLVSTAPKDDDKEETETILEFKGVTPNLFIYPADKCEEVTREQWITLSFHSLMETDPNNATVKNISISRSAEFSLIRGIASETRYQFTFILFVLVDQITGEENATMVVSRQEMEEITGGTLLTTLSFSFDFYPETSMMNMSFMIADWDFDSEDNRLNLMLSVDSNPTFTVFSQRTLPQSGAFSSRFESEETFLNFTFAPHAQVALLTGGTPSLLPVDVDLYFPSSEPSSDSEEERQMQQQIDQFFDQIGEGAGIVVSFPYFAANSSLSLASSFVVGISDEYNDDLDCGEVSREVLLWVLVASAAAVSVAMVCVCVAKLASERKASRAKKRLAAWHGDEDDDDHEGMEMEKLR